MKLAMCQMRMANNVAENYDKSINMFLDAVRLGADLVLFPELQVCPFFPQHEKQNVSAYEMCIGKRLNRMSEFIRTVKNN